MISKILEVDPEKRLSIDEIREHEWMRVENKVTKGIIVGYNKILIDNNILNAMKEYNEDIEYTKKSL